ncbi:hypothetical protein M378DRAFT_341509 [Amanita muscaria Koide BX008]|uniref:Uncharacterized protein n=1 Tax=Amanita muscaria (strain Koide BX008) TaxID=946122 RepID=A0A0C2SVH7_AMAMK|nr:hypothetical protein M378DRAFT_341509 [Amanita muscaria Koide BX008]
MLIPINFFYRSLNKTELLLAIVECLQLSGRDIGRTDSLLSRDDYGEKCSHISMIGISHQLLYNLPWF